MAPGTSGRRRELDPKNAAAFLGRGRLRAKGAREDLARFLALAPRDKEAPAVAAEVAKLSGL
ncbi:hypothetical protein HY251_19110 [bacterium]|nr:hypothetical protein [bacterium]